MTFSQILGRNINDKRVTNLPVAWYIHLDPALLMSKMFEKKHHYNNVHAIVSLKISHRYETDFFHIKPSKLFVFCRQIV